MKNETTKERLIALESRINCFPWGETENLDRMTLSPTKSTQKRSLQEDSDNIFKRDQLYPR